MSLTAEQKLTAEQMYALLPAVYRTRDAANGFPLQALFRVFAGQAAVVKDNIRQLYDDEFIETCARWVIPYIGDLVGASPIYEIGTASQSSRAEVANTIGYRRRKGTLLALEQVSTDVSGMPAKAVEFFKRLIVNDSMRHNRPKHAANVNLRHGRALDGLGSAFDTLSRTIDVRRIAPRLRAVADPDPVPLEIALHGGGKYNIPDVGIYLWRWKSNPVVDAPAFQLDARRFLFSPLGQNAPLFNLPPARESFSGLTTRLDVPQPISRREFHANKGLLYGTSLLLTPDGAPVPASQICCKDLSNWACTPKGKIAIDPVLGRIQFAPDFPAPGALRVNYCYGFPADIGGGPYSRLANLPSFSKDLFPFQQTVGPSETLASAVKAWNAATGLAQGVIYVPDFETYDIDLIGPNAIQVTAGRTLWIVAAKLGPVLGPVFHNSRVVLRGNIEIAGVGQLSMNGVWISGSVQVNDAATVRFTDCTLVPGLGLMNNGLPVHPGEPSIIAPTPGANITLSSSISGPLTVAEGGATHVCSSIIDASSRCAVAYSALDMLSEGADMVIQDSTVIGKVHVRTMTLASDTIFLARRAAKHDTWKAALWCSRKQDGCVRFCSLPGDAITPRRFRCLPGDPVQEAALRPQFITLQYGQPSYALLSGAVPVAVWTGADNGSQMGVYKMLEETEGVRNVQLRTPEFLPFNLEAGVFLEPSATVLIPAPPSYSYGMSIFQPCGDTVDDELWSIGVGAHLM
jgi:hypothetical protein